MKLRLIKFSNVKSTNDEAIKKIKSKKVHAGIVYSYSQTKGRGTMGKKWISFNGNFFITIFFELKKNMPNFKEFSVLNPLILKKLLSRYTNLKIKIKKPNDLLINNKKVCGILQETYKIEKWDKIDEYSAVALAFADHKQSLQGMKFVKILV